MLLEKKHITDDILLGIWQIGETQDKLRAMLNRYDLLGDLSEIKAETRIVEKLATRVLLKEVLGEEKEIRYLPSGKPFLADRSAHISISHTKGYIAVAVSEKRALGLDIEYISERINRVRDRVVSEHEFIEPARQTEHLLLHWCAKEAMFKYIDTENVDFREHLYVHPFRPKVEGTFSVSETRTEKKYALTAYYEIAEQFTLVCVC